MTESILPSKTVETVRERGMGKGGWVPMPLKHKRNAEEKVGWGGRPCALPVVLHAQGKLSWGRSGLWPRQKTGQKSQCGSQERVKELLEAKVHVRGVCVYMCVTSLTCEHACRC